MAAHLCDIPLLNCYCPALPLLSSKFVISGRIQYQNPQLGSYFHGAKTSKWKSGRSGRIRVTASLGGLLGGIFKGTDTGESTRQQYSAIVDNINRLEASTSSLSDSELREKTSLLKERAQNGESLDSLLPVRFLILNCEAFNLPFICF